MVVGTYSIPAKTRHQTQIDLAKNNEIIPTNKPLAIANRAKEAKVLLAGPIPVRGENTAKITRVIATKNGANIDTLLLSVSSILDILTPGFRVVLIVKISFWLLCVKPKK